MPTLAPPGAMPLPLRQALALPTLALPEALPLAGGPRVGRVGGTSSGGRGGRPFSTESWRAIWPTVFSRRTTLSDKPSTVPFDTAETQVLEAGLVPLVPADPCCGSPTARGLDSQETLR